MSKSLHLLQTSSQSGPWNIFSLLRLFLISWSTKCLAFLTYVQFPWNEISTDFTRILSAFLRLQLRLHLPQDVVSYPILLPAQPGIIGQLSYFSNYTKRFSFFNFFWSGQYLLHFESLGTRKYLVLITVSWIEFYSRFLNPILSIFYITWEKIYPKMWDPVLFQNSELFLLN